MHQDEYHSVTPLCGRLGTPTGKADMSDLKHDAAIKSVAAPGQTYAREIRADYDMSCEATVLDCLDIIAFGQRATRNPERTLSLGAKGGDEIRSS
jgi:hypothetical protein